MNDVTGREISQGDLMLQIDGDWSNILMAYNGFSPQYCRTIVINQYPYPNIVEPTFYKSKAKPRRLIILNDEQIAVYIEQKILILQNRYVNQVLNAGAQEMHSQRVQIVTNSYASLLEFSQAIKDGQAIDEFIRVLK